MNSNKTDNESKLISKDLSKINYSKTAVGELSEKLQVITDEISQVNEHLEGIKDSNQANQSMGFLNDITHIHNVA